MTFQLLLSSKNSTSMVECLLADYRPHCPEASYIIWKSSVSVFDAAMCRNLQQTTWAKCNTTLKIISDKLYVSSFSCISTSLSEATCVVLDLITVLCLEDLLISRPCCISNWMASAVLPFVSIIQVFVNTMANASVTTNITKVYSSIAACTKTKENSKIQIFC